jgi:hypothetical protein
LVRVPSVQTVQPVIHSSQVPVAMLAKYPIGHAAIQLFRGVWKYKPLGHPSAAVQLSALPEHVTHRLEQGWQK